MQALALGAKCGDLGASGLAEPSATRIGREQALVAQQRRQRQHPHAIGRVAEKPPAGRENRAQGIRTHSAPLEIRVLKTSRQKQTSPLISRISWSSGFSLRRLAFVVI